ncbi:MAG: hypothetical protein ACLUD0_09245 [Eubacterium ramulus]
MIETYEEITGKSRNSTNPCRCGVWYLLRKMPGLDCISYPQINDIHTTRERLNIESVKRNWELTLAVLKKLK